MPRSCRGTRDCLAIKCGMGVFDSLPRLRLLPGEPAFADTLTDQRAPGEEVATDSPGAHADGGQRCDQVGSQAALPEGLGPLHRPLGMLRMPVQEQHPQGVEVTQKALPVADRTRPSCPARSAAPRPAAWPVSRLSGIGMVSVPALAPARPRASASPVNQADAGCLR